MQRINKKEIDSSFSYKISVYDWSESSKDIVLKVPSNSYISFYLSGAYNVLISKDGEETGTNCKIQPCENDWKFYYYYVDTGGTYRIKYPSEIITKLSVNESIDYINEERKSIIDGNTEYELKSGEDGEQILYKNDTQCTVLSFYPDNVQIAELKVVPYKEEYKDSNFYLLRNSLQNTMYVWKHGQGGLYDNEGKIRPTYWYGKLHEFYFEFVVTADSPHMLKIFNNLIIISNKAEPAKFEFEVVGEGYDWVKYKSIMEWIYKEPENVEERLKKVLSSTYSKLREYDDFPILFNMTDEDTIKKLPDLRVKDFILPGKNYSTDKDKTPPPHLERSISPTPNFYSQNTSETVLVHDDQLSEDRVRTILYGNNIQKFGRILGNMHYLEDKWNVEIRPISFQWITLKDGNLVKSNRTETRLRDKFIKIKVRYTGEDLVVILGIQTLFNYSFA